MIDEIYVDPRYRGRRYATDLIETLARRAPPLGSPVAALLLEITPGNARARRLYERLGFAAKNLAMRRLLDP